MSRLSELVGGGSGCREVDAKAANHREEFLVDVGRDGVRLRSRDL
jgi:hypothetical protein